MRCAVCGKRHTTRWPLIFALTFFAVFVTLLISCTESAGATSLREGEGALVPFSEAVVGRNPGGLTTTPSPPPLLSEDRCAADFDADTFIDTGDIAQLTAVFGTNAPALDIAPELAPNGWVDTADLSMVTAHFGERCYGFQGSEAIGGTPFMQVTSCAFKVEGWWKATWPPWAIVQPMAGITGCYVGFDAAYSAICHLEIEAWNGWGWYVVDGSDYNGTPWMVNGVLRCSAENDSAVGVPMYTALREKMCHQIWRDGVSVHGYHCHYSPTSFYIPCNPAQPEMC